MTSCAGTGRHPDRLVVASVPGSHVYVRHLEPEIPGRSDPVRLPDPDPAAPWRPAGAAWWPPAMLDPAWVARADFDVFHLHFGFDACSPERLVELVRMLRERGKPLLFTVHDLRNPHHASSALHDEQLDVLVPAANGLITLTAGAASVIMRRWGRSARVLPHPHVVELERAALLRGRRTTRRASFRVGLHVKSLRASMAPHLILPTLVETVGSLPGAVLQVDGHRDVLEPGGRRYDAVLAAQLREAEATGALELRVHDYFSDDQLWGYLASLDVSVLPYRFGSHSGWLEACRDLGTTVVAPSCGFYRDQGPVLSYRLDEEQYEPASLADAVTSAYEQRPDLAADLTERLEQRADLAQAHARIYAALHRCSTQGPVCASA